MEKITPELFKTTRGYSTFFKLKSWGFRASALSLMTNIIHGIGSDCKQNDNTIHPFIRTSGSFWSNLPTLLNQVHLNQVVEGLARLSSEQLQGWKKPIFSKQLVPMSDHLQCETFFLVSNQEFQYSNLCPPKCCLSSNPYADWGSRRQKWD